MAAREATASAVASAVLNWYRAAANLGAAATAATSLANEGRRPAGKGFLSDSQKEGLNTATFFLGSIAGATGVAAGAADLAGKGAETQPRRRDQLA